MKIKLSFFILLSSLLFAQPQPYVVLISFDAFRWDYSERGITPNLQKMKDNGVTAKSLRSCFPSKTFPNHLSLITGMYPENHGIISNDMHNLRTGAKYSLGNREEVENPAWYKGVAFWELAGKNDIKCASYYWPSSEVSDPSRRPAYWKKYNMDTPYKNRVDTVIHWLSLPYSDRPHFITVYFHDTDSYGHKYGPNSDEVNASIARLDSLISFLYDGIEQTGLKDSVNVIVVSDHGMTEIYPDKIIEVKNITTYDDYEHIGSGPFLMIEPGETNYDEVFNELSLAENYFNTYTKRTIPKYFHYSNNELIYSLILVADPGWTLVYSRENADWFEYDKGNHGYDNFTLDMHGTFIAAGPDFKQNYKTGTLRNIDLFPLLARIFNLKIEHTIDGNLDNIIHILKEK